MNPIMENNLQRILNSALQSEFGIQILVESFGSQPVPSVTLRAKQLFYQVKKKTPDFRDLQIRLCPNDADRRLWITKKSDLEQHVDENSEELEQEDIVEI